MPEQDPLDNYDSESVVYCSKCYSLKIQHDADIDTDYCMDCGCTDVLESSIEEWEKKYERRYGHKFAEKNSDHRKSPIFQMPLNKLMHKVYECPKWKDIIRSVYNHFPKGLGRADSIVLFFDKLVKDNQLDKLRELLYKMKI